VPVFVLAGTFFVAQNASAENTADESLGVSKNPVSAKSIAPLTAPHIFSASAVFRNAQYGTTRGMTSQRLRQSAQASSISIDLQHNLLLTT
jgi:hypothetical protein